MSIAATWMLMTSLIPISIIIRHFIPVLAYYFLVQIIGLVSIAIVLLALPRYKKLYLSAYALSLLVGVVATIAISISGFYARGVSAD
jgi:hypothetical protein